LLKDLKEENALKLVRPVYRNVDVARENAFTYSDLIFVFFHEGSSMADIKKSLKKNKLNLVQGIEEDFSNDTYFGYQWHYFTINCPLAWDVTHGSSSVDIAIH